MNIFVNISKIKQPRKRESNVNISKIDSVAVWGTINSFTLWSMQRHEHDGFWQSVTLTLKRVKGRNHINRQRKGPITIHFNVLIRRWLIRISSDLNTTSAVLHHLLCTHCSIFFFLYLWLWIPTKHPTILFSFNLSFLLS